LSGLGLAQLPAFRGVVARAVERQRAVLSFRATTGATEAEAERVEESWPYPIAVLERAALAGWDWRGNEPPGLYLLALSV
jgi:hypothetical protein